MCVLINSFKFVFVDLMARLISIVLGKIIKTDSVMLVENIGWVMKLCIN